jgi:hypothetical protein
MAVATALQPVDEAIGPPHQPVIARFVPRQRGIDGGHVGAQHVAQPQLAPDHSM